MYNPAMAAPTGQGMANPGFVQPQFGGGPESIFDTPDNTIEFTQEEHCCKCCCPICFGPDKFSAKTALSSTITETSTWLWRNILNCFAGCFQKKATWNFEIGQQSALIYNQAGSCYLTAGHVGEVSLGNRPIGKTGLLCGGCDFSKGIKNAAIDTVGLCGSIFGGLGAGRIGYKIWSNYCCLCMGLSTNALRVYDLNGKILYNVRASCLQLGVLMPLLPCEPCRNVEHIVEDQEGKETAKIAQFYNAELLCCKHSDKFKVHFPPGANREIKGLLFGAALGLHYTYFDL